MTSFPEHNTESNRTNWRIKYNIIRIYNSSRQKKPLSPQTKKDQYKFTPCVVSKGSETIMADFHEKYRA